MRPAKNYKVDVAKGPACAVVEKPTGLVLYECGDTREAKQIANFLNGGNAFNGYTPAFFLNRWAVDDIS
jgi:hypothetical protein